MSKFAQKFKLLASTLQAKTDVVDKIHLTIVLIKSAGEFIFKALVRNKATFQKILVKNLQNKIFKIRYGRFNLFLTIDEILQGIHSEKREAHIPFQKWIRPGNVVCDVGAHIGTHTLKLAEIVGKEGKVISLEPNLKNFGLLSLNISTNNFSKQIVPFRVALASKCGKMRLYNLGKSMYFSLVRKSNDYEDVDTISFENLFKITEVEAIDFMKMDIEGAEEDLILSEISTFKNGRIKALYVDPHDGVNYDAIISHLAKFNYKYQKLDSGHLFYQPERGSQDD